MLEWIKGFLSADMLAWVNGINPLEWILIWVISQVVSVKVLAKGLVKLIKKTPEWMRKPLLTFVDSFAKAVDEEIVDTEKTK